MIRAIENDLVLQQHADSIKKNEFATALQLLAKPGLSQIDQLGEFASETYHRVGDMFEHQDFSQCSNLMMVGCGPFPATVLHISARYPGIKITAIDADKAAIEMANKVISKLCLSDRVQAILSQGEIYNYASADIVYVANLVRPKQATLSKIADTVKFGTLTILRDPSSSTEPIAESGLNKLDERWDIEGMGETNKRFQSRHIFLRKVSDLIGQKTDEKNKLTADIAPEI